MSAAIAPPWRALPPAMGAMLRPHLEVVTAAVIDAVSEQVPDYTRSLEGDFGRTLRRGVQVALGRFLDLPGTDEPALTAADRRVYLGLGRGELLSGRELQALLAAYRVGARVAFNQFATFTRDGGLGETLITLAEAMFAYIDELSAASVEGYTLEQSLRAGETDRRRAELLTLLLSGASDTAAVAAAAARAGWTVPDRVVTVVVGADHDPALPLRLGSAALHTPVDDTVVIVLPAPTSRRARDQLRRDLRGSRAAVGTDGPVDAVPAGRRTAALAHSLLGSGVISGDPVFADEHLADLVVHRDASLVGELSRRRLAAFEALPAGTAARLRETLLAWLQHRGERQKIAAALSIHPQTVGYRLGQLRELLGDALDDPQSRFELELSLRADRPASSAG